MLDLVRASCLVVVVVLHALMAGITVDAGGIHIVNAMDEAEWFVPASWFVQVMPLFFIVGGFAGITQWRRMRDQGRSAFEFVRGRLERLARPALLAFAVVGAGLAVAGLAGAPADLLAQVGYRMGQPMWFLGVYLGVSALVPVLVRAHENAPLRTLGGLLALVLAVDVLASAAPAAGFANLAFVWLTVQQIGFCYADGWFRDRAWSAGGAAGALALLLVITAGGLYSANMYTNLNPPTVCLVLLGVAQICLVALAAPRLRRWLERPRPRECADAMGRCSLTVYLWHMPALVLLAAVLLVARAPWPEVFSAGWWLTRLPWIAGIALIVRAVAAVVGGVERRAAGAGAPSAGAAALGVLTAITGVVVVLVAGFTAVSAAVGAALLAASLGLVRPRPDALPARRSFALATRSA
ncbi:acyltransferase family protein [Saccharopolyspora erythraea]|nr:acyltransferase [Saccharopolyspora erythraea]EQD83242.1 membrane protein [Saccharopolyspora erythraea D]QRK91525.1 acyltransferase [Saccharopolyspora erythraea]